MAVLLVFLLLHHNPWVWSDRRLIAGVPVNLAFHLILCLLAAAVMLLIVRRAWPRYPGEE